jgi:hypothetical protein
VPEASECTTAKPRGTHWFTSAFEMRVRSGWYSAPCIAPRFGGSAPSSWRMSQNAKVRATPAKYGLDW